MPYRVGDIVIVKRSSYNDLWLKGINRIWKIKRVEPYTDGKYDYSCYPVLVNNPFKEHLYCDGWWFFSLFVTDLLSFDPELIDYFDKNTLKALYSRIANDKPIDNDFLKSLQ